MIDCQQHVVSRFLGGTQQLSVFLSLQPCPFGCVRIVMMKAVPEIEWEALIQQDFHAIRASRESFASSSD